MTRDAYTTKLRVLLCPNCAATISSASEGGRYRCEYCGAIGVIDARIDAHAGHAPIDEAARLAGLRLQFEQGHLASPYSPYLVPKDVLHLLELRPPASDAPWRKAWKRAVEKLAHKASKTAQRRVYCLANMVSTAVLSLGQTDPLRARAVLETAIELLPDAGYKQIFRCDLVSSALRAGDLASAQTWLAGCDPHAHNLTVDTNYRVAAARIHCARGEWAPMLALLGREPDEIPIEWSCDVLAGLLRVHALEAVGERAAADAQLDHWIQRDQRRDGPTVGPCLESNAYMGLCQSTCGRRGMQIAQG